MKVVRCSFVRLVLILAVICVGVAAIDTPAPESDNWLSPDLLFSPDYEEFILSQIRRMKEEEPISSPLRPIIQLKDGSRLQGIRVENSTVNAFKGIRFAEAPIGNLRWAPPKAYVNPDPSVLVEAGRSGPICVQGIPLSSPLGQEDCLFLNVWAPVEATRASKLPVGVFIHGGSYNTGASSMYSGAEMVEFYKGKAIIVSINYRLNVFGFLGSEILRAQDPENGSTGNQGVQDQRMALKWVQENIGAFGGDKSRVMIFGESAGGGSISCHLTNQKSWGLFSSATIESGSFTNWMAQPMNVAEDKFQVLLSKSGCASEFDVPESALSCLLSKSTQEIFEWSNAISSVSTYCTFSPTADGVEMATHPWITLSEGTVADVPILHGTNRDETAIFDLLPKDATLAQAERFWKRKEYYPGYMYTDADIATLEALYLPQTYPDVKDVSQEFWAAAHSTGDSHFACGARYMSLVLADLQAQGKRTSDMYVYNFQHARAHMRFVSHFSEVPYVFNWGYLGFRHQQADQDMADVMTTYWGNFIISNNPSSGDVDYSYPLPTWEPFTNSSEKVILLPSREGISITSGLKKDECAFMIPLLDKSLRAAFA